MMLPKYERTISLLCPTCGSSQFSSSDDEGAPVECVTCGRQLTRDELIRENGESIDLHAKELGEQALEDAAKQLKKSLSDAFRNSKFIKIK